jgi:hypothetical protein
VTRSTFVTVVAWIFTVISGFMTMISILQNIMVQTMFDNPQMDEALRAAPPPGTPPVVTFMASHFQLLFLVFLVFSAITLIASIGLLRRKNWARLLFIGLMALGIAWNLGGLVLQLTMFSAMQGSFANVQGAPDMKGFFIAMTVISVVMALGFSGLFGWIAKRLLSPAIVAEFKQ